MNYITFDIETYSPSESSKIDTSELRVSVVGAYLSWTKEYIAFLEEDVQTFLDLLFQADMVVGYNHVWFDLPVLQKYAKWNLKKINNYDILLEIEKKLGFKMKLDDLAKANLGTQKTDSYETYRHYHKPCEGLKLIEYCLNDVTITERVFQLIQKGQVLTYQDMLSTKEFVLEPPSLTQRMEIEQNLIPESIF